MLSSLVFYSLPLILVFLAFAVWRLGERVETLIHQHWDLLDYTSSNGVTSKDLVAFNEAKNRRLAEKEKEL